MFHLTAADHIPLLLSKLPAWLIFVFEHGKLGVPVFFVLSGFVIAHSVHDKRVTVPLAGRFMLRRSLRLDPPYWLAIGLTLGFAVLSTFVVKGKQIPDVTVPQIVAHLFYLQDILGYPEINSVFWTLCMEVQFYLVYVFLLALGKNDPSRRMQGWPVLTILSFAVIVSLLWPIGLVKAEPWRGSFFPLWHGFLLGVAAYWSWRYVELRTYFVAFAAIVAVAAVLRSDSFALTCATIAVLLFGAACLGKITSALRWRWLQFLGAISYSLYLMHNPITGASFRAGYMLTGHTLLTEILWATMALVACILCAAAAYYLVEKPSIKLSRMIDLDRPVFNFLFPLATASFRRFRREPKLPNS